MTARSTPNGERGPNPGGWATLSAEHKKKLLSAYARFGGVWPEYLVRDILRCPVPPAVQEQADKLRDAFLKEPRREDWLGDYPGSGV